MTAPPPTTTGHDARRRDRHRLAATAASGVVAVAAITATGAAAGHLAREQAEQDAADRPERTSTARPQPRQRPTRVRVTTRYVSAATGEVVDRDAAVRTAPAPAPAPAPEPPPAPTSGS